MKDLNKIANDFFAKNKEAKKIYVTDDGYVFLNKNMADLHAKSNPAGKKLTVKEFENGSKPKNDETAKLTAEERIEKIMQAETVAEVEELLKGEKAKTVKEAGAQKIAELQAKETGADSPEDGNENQNDNE